MFTDFDFKVLDDPDFKEDAVREELILPLIKRLGYSVTGNDRVIRSKSLVHPFVSIGSKKRKISIIPDYMFLSDNSPYWILDAKSPTESIVRSEHAEQAYSYAIHPEVRAELFALCNGREFALYSTRKFEPVIHFKLSDIDKHWDSLYRILNPKIKANPQLLEYQLDYGVYIKKCGAVEDFKFIALAVHSSFICKVEENCYTTMSVIPGDRECLISLYFDESQYQHLLSLQSDSVRSKVSSSLKAMPYYVSIEPEEMLFAVEATISSEVIDNPEESFIPFIVDSFMEYMSCPDIPNESLMQD